MTEPDLAGIVSSGGVLAFAVAVYYLLTKHTARVERHVERTIEVLTEMRVALDTLVGRWTDKVVPIKRYREKDTDKMVRGDD